MKLVIAEKPSVAQAIAKALCVKERKDGYIQGESYIISWCVGHLVGLANAIDYDEKYEKWRYDTLPILPDKWKLAVAASTVKQFKILSGLMRDKKISSLVCATDAGREGELIFRFVYEKSDCTKPFERLWISSMEDAAICEGFTNLKDGLEYNNLYDAALCRAKADWLVGINATRLFSVLYGATLNVGRVQSPTLAMLVERDANIKGFKKEKYYHTRITCGSFEAVSERIKDKDQAEKMRMVCHSSQAEVSSVTQEQKTINPPHLYDLTTLQREANRFYGYTAQQTLDILQSLYEKKLVTYPRTDSQYLTEDMKETAASIATYLMKTPPFAQGQPFTPDISRILNNAKVSDHHAIIPTAQLMRTDISNIPEAEKTILMLIAMKLLCAIADKHTFDSMIAVLECCGFSFTAKGKTITQTGWKEIEQSFKASMKAKQKNKGKKSGDEDEEQGGSLPLLAEGQIFDNVNAITTAHSSTPPKPYTEDTLLSAMETAGNEDLDKNADVEKKGLGTPATRAATIEAIVKHGFAVREKKQLLPTENGIKLVSILPEELKSAKLTAEWENTLTQIAQGALPASEFMAEIEQFTKKLVITHSAVDAEKKNLFRVPREIIGNCPVCKGNVYEFKGKDSKDKAAHRFYCENKECNFTMWANDYFFSNKKVALTKEMVVKLLRDGKTSVIKGLYSKTKDSTYDAAIFIEEVTERKIKYGLEFANKKQ